MRELYIYIFFSTHWRCWHIILRSSTALRASRQLCAVVVEEHRRRSSVNFGEEAINVCPKIYVWKINKIPEFYMTLARKKINNMPQFYFIFAPKLNNTNTRLPEKYFPNFRMANAPRHRSPSPMLKNAELNHLRFNVFYPLTLRAL